MGRQRGRGRDQGDKANSSSLSNEYESGATVYSKWSAEGSINSKQSKHKPPLPPASASNKAKENNVSARYKPPRVKKKPAVERDPKTDKNDLSGVSEGEYSKVDEASLLLQLRQVSNEVKGLRRDVAAADRERSVWKRRDDDLSLTLARLENRCEALEVSLRAESDAADVEAARAKSAEDRFQKLLAWARKEEGRRRLAEEKLATVREEGRALEARMGVAKNEAIVGKRQLDTRRLHLEGALEDLRRRTAENERLDEQTKLMGGELVALRELADGRGLELRELRHKMARLVEEAKCMSSENIKVRKQLNGERERWRAAERSRVAQEHRRQMEVERKTDDVHALRYRLQELEARLSREIAMRKGAEEDARRSQQMEQRSAEELMEIRKAQKPNQPVLSNRSYPAQNSVPRVDNPALSADSPWPSWTGGRDTAAAAPPPSGGPSCVSPDVVSSHDRLNRTAHLRPWKPWKYLEKRRDGLTPANSFLQLAEESQTPLPPPCPSATRTPSAPRSRSSQRRCPCWASPPAGGSAEVVAAPAEPLPLSRQLPRGPEKARHLDRPRQGRPRPRQLPSEGCHSVGGVHDNRSECEDGRELDEERQSEEGDRDNDGVGVYGGSGSDGSGIAIEGVSRLKERLVDVVTM